MIELDVELALTSSPPSDLASLSNRLPSLYYCEDKSNLGWGIIIRYSGDLSGNLDLAVRQFLEGLCDEDLIPANGTNVLRVAVQHDFCALTLNLRTAIPVLNKLGLEFELSCYSIDEDFEKKEETDLTS